MKTMKIVSLIAILGLATISQAQFNPPLPGKPKPYLSCRGSGDYPSAGIYYNPANHTFKVAVTYDLDVPGGATGTIQRTGVGSVTAQGISIKFTDGAGVVQGVYKDGFYQIQTQYGNFSCYVVRP